MSTSHGTGYFTNALVTFVKRKQENLPTQVGLDIFQSDVDARSIGRLLKVLKATVLRVGTHDDLSRAFLSFWHHKLWSAAGTQCQKRYYVDAIFPHIDV